MSCAATARRSSSLVFRLVSLSPPSSFFFLVVRAPAIIIAVTRCIVASSASRANIARTALAPVVMLPAVDVTHSTCIPLAGCACQPVPVLKRRHIPTMHECGVCYDYSAYWQCGVCNDWMCEEHVEECEYCEVILCRWHKIQFMHDCIHERDEFVWTDWGPPSSSEYESDSEYSRELSTTAPSAFTADGL